MLKTYKTRIGFTVIFAIALAYMVFLIPVCLFDINWAFVLIISMLMAAAIDSVMHIKYVIFDDTLTVKSGLFVEDAHYKISEISSIQKTNSILSAPAASLKRIAIFFHGQKRPLVISPRNEADFIAQLKSINPEIQTF